MFLKSKIYKIAVALIPLTVYSISIQAQENKPTEDKTQFGLKAGLNFAELYGKDALPESDRKLGYSAGVFTSFKISKDVKFVPELIWSLQGEKSKESGRYKISYLNIPMMIKWQSKKFYTEFGPQLGLLTINTTKSVPENLRLDNFESYDLSFNIGLGFQLFPDWSFGLRYCQGITNIVSGRDLRNSVVYVGLSYRIL